MVVLILGMASRGSKGVHVPEVESLQVFFVVAFETSTIRLPSLRHLNPLVIRLFSQFHHPVQLLLQSLSVRSNLPQHLISVKTEHELRFSPHSVMFGDFG